MSTDSPAPIFPTTPATPEASLPAGPVVARVTPIWKKQKLFIAIFLLAIGGWFLWDGKVGYPRSNERFLAHEKFEKEGKSADWPAYAESRGWTEEPPHKLFKPDDIFMQFACAALTGLIGLITLAYWATQQGRVLRMDDDAITTPAGTRVPFGSVTGVGKKKWDAKGLATVRYELEGKKGQFILDDYKFDRDPTHAVLAKIEERLSASA